MSATYFLSCYHVSKILLATSLWIKRPWPHIEYSYSMLFTYWSGLVTWKSFFSSYIHDAQWRQTKKQSRWCQEKQSVSWKYNFKNVHFLPTFFEMVVWWFLLFQDKENCCARVIGSYCFLAVWPPYKMHQIPFLTRKFKLVFIPVQHSSTLC